MNSTNDVEIITIKKYLNMFPNIIYDFERSKKSKYFQTFLNELVNTKTTFEILLQNFSNTSVRLLRDISTSEFMRLETMLKENITILQTNSNIIDKERIQVLFETIDNTINTRNRTDLERYSLHKSRYIVLPKFVRNIRSRNIIGTRDEINDYINLTLKNLQDIIVYTEKNLNEETSKKENIIKTYITQQEIIYQAISTIGSFLTSYHSLDDLKNELIVLLNKIDRCIKNIHSEFEKMSSKSNLFTDLNERIVVIRISHQ